MENVRFLTEKEVRQMTNRALSTLRNDRFLNRGDTLCKNRSLCALRNG